MGTLYPNRVQLIEYILQKYPVYYAYTRDRFSEIVSISKINLNLGIMPTGNQQRIFEILCMGGFFMTNNIPDNNKIFIDRQHLIYYDESNIFDIIDYYLKNEAERKIIAKEGRKEVLAKHTYECRVKQIVKDVENKWNL